MRTKLIFLLVTLSSQLKEITFAADLECRYLNATQSEWNFYNCPGNTSQFVFCCQDSFGTPGECCYQPYVWQLWYFWVGIIFSIVLLVLLGIGIFFFMKSYKQKQQTHHIQTTYSTNSMNFEESPPSYDNLTMQSNHATPGLYDGGEDSPPAALHSDNSPHSPASPSYDTGGNTSPDSIPM